ncbi:MAG: urea transporter [Muribaculaceae bacterium]|nr:urea transporter [Muribaculaceae bacterium]
MAQLYTLRQAAKDFPRTCLRGIGQVMFQDSMWTGLLFLAGIIWGAYEEGFGVVAWGVVVGTVVSTLTGYILQLPDQNGANGLWGFNGCLVGAAFPTFMGDTVWMWIALILCSAFSTWVRTGMDNVLGRWKMSSFTFPFVLSTYFFLLASRLFANMPPEFMGSPELPVGDGGTLAAGFGDLVVYWLKGISQVFLINSWVTGLFFLAGLAVSSIRAAAWAAISSAVALLVVIVWKGPAHDIADGLYGFSAVLTGIALGATYCNNSWKTWIWTLLGVVMTVFIQAAMNAFFSPMGLPTLTGPFCVATWMFLFPDFSFFAPKAVAPKPAAAKPDPQPQK